MGSGEDDTGVIAGSVFGTVCTVCLCIFGLPLVLAGSLMINFGSGDVYLAGIIIIVISSLVTIAATILTILMCCGCCCPRTSNENQSHVIVVQPQTAHYQGQAQLPSSPCPPVVYVPPGHGMPPQAPAGGYPAPLHSSEQHYLLQYQQEAGTPGQVSSRPPPFNPHYSDAPSAYPSAPPSYDDTMTNSHPYQQTYPHK